ncbi:MAG: hypothetical protein JNM84_00270 [Planctomycetes bacterium]|nr:hypothetical protein [Planctomycetota bacterium]
MAGSPFRSVPTLLSLLALAPLAAAQVDLAEIQQLEATANARAQQALKDSLAAVQAAREAIGDPQNKVQGDLDEVAMKLAGEEFGGAIGAQRLAVDHLEYVAEEARARTLEKLLALARVLELGFRVQEQRYALAEIALRLGYVEQARADGYDLTSSLRDLEDSTAKALRSAALPRTTMAKLRALLARDQAAARAKRAADQLVLAEAELVRLEESWKELRTELASEESGVRDSAFSKLDEARRAIRTALAEVPARDAAPLLARLEPKENDGRALYAASYGPACRERLQGVWETYASEFEGWAEESATASAEDYLNIDGSSIDKLNHPLTAAVYSRAIQWLAFVGTDEDYLRAAEHAAVRELAQGIEAMRAKALARLVAAAEAMVAALEQAPPRDETARNRVANLAEWDLRLLLQDAPPQWPLVARLRAIVDAFDRAALEVPAAKAKAQSEAVASVEANWTRMLQRLPITYGFEPALAATFRGRLVLLQGVRNRAEEFAPTDAATNLIFGQGGHLFVARLSPAAIAWRDRELARLGFSLTPDDEVELLATVEDPLELRLLGPSGKVDDGVSEPARALRVIGLRVGPVAFVESPFASAR